MAGLQSLPSELIELIFRFLGSIDDVHYLGRACQKTFSIIQRQALYVSIMRSVITQAPQHRYDLQLYKNPLPATWANQLPHASNDWECALVGATTPNSCAKTSCTQCLPDEVIYDILARYQGLQVLEDLWLERQVDASDFFSADESPDANALTLARGYQVVINRDEMYRDGELPARRSTTLGAAEHATLKPDQRARFYSAVTFVWFLNEIRWAFTNATFPTRFDVQRRILEACKEHFSAQTRTPLLDELDRYAMFRFLYHHLLPVYGTFLADQCVGELPFTFSTDFDKDFGFTSRLLQLFVTAAQTYFQPPDLIDLVIRSKASRYPPYAVVTLPGSTKTWQRPSQAFTFTHPPSRRRPFALYDYRPMTLFDPRCHRLISRRTATHLNLIARSSFHQTTHTVSPTVRMPMSPNHAYNMRDHAAEYFLEQVLVAFDMYANPDPELGDVRECFKKRWDDKLWEVWWWAGGEDKARAKMERWRKEEVRAG
ncbi:hypothetical protein BDU57DRAFT_498901 [Ampelomyces quisqualis]|uniref:F-box domain-containing protein n=1 Tax=Ampelomyces quisqualis TaxID=50730 RepID=A0A6A5QHC6_AMPQU|nr:hypothetical protein BDU57DRAFT_498901 [Ampelomyces quisqualis]